MFVNLFIGNPPSTVDSDDVKDELFSLEKTKGNRTCLYNHINDRWVAFQQIPTGKGLSVTESTHIVDHESGCILGCVSSATIAGFHNRITHEYTNLNPRFSQIELDENSDTIPSQIFVNIDTSLFTPIIYEIPDNMSVRDAYHYGHHYYGFIVEVEENLSGTEASDGIRIYGYDNRIEKKNEMSCFRVIQLSIDATYEETEEGVKNPSDDWKQVKHMIEFSNSGMNMENRKKFFKLRSMYNKNKEPRLIPLSGPLFSTYIIGTKPTKVAKELIATAKEKNQVPVGTPYHYIYVPVEDFEDEKDWYKNGVVKELHELYKKKVRAVTITEDIRIKLKDVRYAKIQQVLSLHDDGTITSVLSNR